MAEKLIMIDGNSLIFRAFHALPPMNMDNGMQVNAAYGFFSMLLNLVQEQQPQYMAVAFDLKGPTFRKEMYAGYKATRAKTPEELLEQFPLIKQALNLLNIKILQIPGYEADDIIGTMTARADAEGMDSYIYTGDRDSLQLISEHTKVMLTRKGVSEIEIYDLGHLQEILGLEPWQIIDMKGLMGDASDNIPGIAGVGEKTALKLLHQFGSVEKLYERIDELPKNKMREKVENGRESAFFSKQLATIERNVPLHVDLQELRFEGLDSQCLYEVLDSFGFQSMIKRLGLKREKIQKATKIEIGKEEELEEAIIQIRKVKKMALCFDEEKFLFSAEEDTAYSIGMQQNLFGDTLSWQQVLQRLKEVLEDKTIEKTVYDAKRIKHICAELQILLQGVVFDVMLAEYVLNPTLRDFSLTKLQDTYDAEEDAAALFTIRNAQEQAIEKQDLGIVFYEIEMPLSEVLFQMEREGFEIDTELLNSFSQQYAGSIETLKGQIYELAGTDDFNIASTKQLGSILFEKLGLPVVKKTKTGYSTNAEVLEKLSGMHPIIDKISEYRLLTKLKSTYLDGLAILADPQTHKVHTTFSQTATATGRISSIEPNLQNIPVRSEFTSHIRELFIPSRSDGFIIAADYSQIELRVLAHISQDAHMCDAFIHDEDIHARTASEIFGVSLQEVTPEMRSSSKAVNFGIVYGISDFGLAKNLGIPRYKAEEYINRYLEEFTGVRRYMQQIVQQARQDGYVKTLYGRIRYVPELASSNYNTRSFGERVALNTPIQGTAADIIKIAMINVARVFAERQLASKLISQVHDELIVDAVPEEVEVVKEILKQTMESVIRLEVPLKSNVAIGKNWAEAK